MSMPLAAAWTLARLGDICHIEMGTSPPGSTYNAKGFGPLLLNGPTEFGPVHPKAVQWTTEPTRFAEPGDFLFCVRGATTGRKNWADQRYCIGRGLASIRGKEGIADTGFLWFLLDFVTESLVKHAAGSTFVNLPGAELESFQVSLPPLSEQQRIAAILQDQMAAVERARAAAEARVEASNVLPAAYLRSIFDGNIAKWPLARLGEITDLLPSKSISTNGDTEVRAITTACLSERGFLPDGVKQARMRMSDVDECKVAIGEVLVARSNTPELVGRVSMYVGQPPEVVASDLTIRVWARDGIMPAFLSAYLSYLYLTEYWKWRAGGASGSMKKITREQLKALRFPVPLAETQDLICKTLAERMSSAASLQSAIAAEKDAIESLSTGFLDQAFHGGL